MAVTPQYLAQLEQQHGLPQGLLYAVMMKESSGNPNAVGPVTKNGQQAQGLFQFMPDTAKSYGIDPFDPTQAALGAARMYSDLNKQYKGDLPSMLAAYNWGSGNLAKHGIQNAPAETRDYINTIAGQIQNQAPMQQVAQNTAQMNDASPAAAQMFSVTMPDGVVVENIPAGTPPEEIEAAWKAMTGQQAPLDIAPQPQDTSTGRTALEQGLGGATFNMADEAYDRIGATIAPALAALPTWLGGNPELTSQDFGSYSDRVGEARAATNKRLDAQIQERPLLSIGSQLGGALLTGGAGATTKGGAALSRGLSSGKVLGRNLGLAGRAGKSGATGATAAGLAGFGAGSDEESRVSNAIDSAKAGGGLGAALPIAGTALRRLVGAPIKKGADALVDAVATRSGEIVTPPQNKAMSRVYGRMAADMSPEDMKSALASFASTPDKSLLQSGGGRLANLAEGAAQYPSGGARAAEYFTQAVSKAPDKLQSTLRATISPNVNYYNALDDIVTTGRKNAAPLYTQAFKENQSVSSKLIDQILDTPEGKSALGNAVKNMRNEMALVAKPDKELTALAKEADMLATGVGVGKGLKLKTLDYVKRAMDDTINSSMRAGDMAEARRITALKNGLVSEMDKLDKSGAYAKARAVAGDYITNRNAMELGSDFLKQDFQIVTKQFGEMGASEKAAYKVGVMKALRDNIAMREDGQNVTRIFNKQATREKLKSILGTREYVKLNKDIQATDALYRLRNQVLSNSRTAQRQIAAEEFTDETASLVNDIATKGITHTAMSRAVSTIARQFDGLGDKAAKDVADIIFETDPKKKYQIAKDLSNMAAKKNPRALEAARKLEVFYKMSDAIDDAQRKLATTEAAATVGAGGSLSERQPTRIDVNPNQPNPYKE